MSRTFTLFRTIAAPVGQSTHDMYKIPTGRSAIVDINILWNNYIPNDNSDTDPSIYISVNIKKQAGGSVSVGNDNFSSHNSLKLKRCILESGDTISISLNGLKASSFNIIVAISGILQ